MSVQAASQVRPRYLVRHYIALLRIHYHVSFVGVLLGVLIVTRQWSGTLVGRIFLLYISLNLLLYGGFYSLNAITDAEADSRRPFKQSRPVASGAISRKAAAVFATVLIAAGFMTGLAWFGVEIFPAYVLFFALNLSYSLFARNVFLLDIFGNSVTHPPRFWLGIWLAGGALRWDWLLLVFLFAVGLSASRRSVLLSRGSWETQGPLARYSRLNLLVIKGAALGAILLLWILLRPDFQIPYVVTVAAYLICVGGIEAIPGIRSFFEKLWLR